MIAAERANGSFTCASSRAECIDSSGMPTSTVRMPSLVAVSGPIVEPQGTVLFETNYWNGTPAAALQRAHRAAPAASVA